MVLRETQFDGTSYVCPTSNQMDDYTFQLAKQIIETNQPIDKVVALAKGAWTWARTLVDHLDVDSLSSMRVKSYRDVNQKGRPVITQPLTERVDDMDVLLFDDVVDSGDTLCVAKKYLVDMGVKTLAVAALCYKPRSTVKPDYYAFETESWVVFPHENREFTFQSCDKWLAAGLSLDQAMERLLVIGLPPDQVEFFVGLYAKSLPNSSA